MSDPQHNPQDETHREASQQQHEAAGERASDTKVAGPDDAGKDATQREEYEGVPGPAISWVQDLDVYPLRDASEDPRWTLWIFWIWFTIACSMIVGMVVWTIAAWFYD